MLVPGKVYRGKRNRAGTASVYISEGYQVRPLNPRFDLRSHSPTGFEFGYGGSGPAQLALALCADALGDDGRALAVYQAFKARAIARLPQDEEWTLTPQQVVEVVEQLERERSAV